MLSDMATPFQLHMEHIIQCIYPELSHKTMAGQEQK